MHVRLVCGRPRDQSSRLATFFRGVDHEIISTDMLFPPLIKKDSCQLLAKECALSTGKPPRTMRIGYLTASEITWKVSKGRKIPTQQQQNNCLPLPSGNLQTPFQSILWCYLPISSSLFLSLSHSLILRCSHTIWVSISSPCLALQLHSLFCCKPPRSAHGLCRKCSEVSYSISSQWLRSFFRVLLSRSSSHRHKGK